MANRRPRFHDQPLTDTDRVLYVEISPGIYALAVASVISSETGSVIAEIDETTRSLRIIETVHAEIHEGEAFSVSYKSPDAVPIADDGTIVFMLTTVARTAHLIVAAAGGGDAQVELREDATLEGGTAMVPFNRNRLSAETATVTVVRDPAGIPAPGTLIDDILLPGGTGGNSPGIIGGQRVEWILALNSTYLLRLTNRAGNAQPMSLEALWYEENM